MRPPPTLLLQCLNVLVATSLYLGIKLATTTWTAAGWTPFQVSLPVTLGCMAYGLSVSGAGRMADRVPRALVSMVGAGIGILSAVIPLVWPGPASCVADVILVFLGAAIFFPGIAGLFSDAASSRSDATPLHRRVSQYNLGWSIGTVLGMSIASLLGSPFLHMAGTVGELRLGYTIMILAFATTIALLAPYRTKAQVPAQASGDRSDHPALQPLILMGRLGLLMACLVGFSLISQLDSALVGSSLHDAGAAARASELAAMSLACYCAGYVTQFLLLGRWGGWILQPWRLWLLQGGLLLGPLGLLLLGQSGWQPPLAIAACTYITGLGYGAVLHRQHLLQPAAAALARRGRQDCMRPSWPPATPSRRCSQPGCCSCWWGAACPRSARWR